MRDRTAAIGEPPSKKRPRDDAEEPVAKRAAQGPAAADSPEPPDLAPSAPSLVDELSADLDQFQCERQAMEKELALHSSEAPDPGALACPPDMRISEKAAVLARKWENLMSEEELNPKSKEFTDDSWSALRLIAERAQVEITFVKSWAPCKARSLLLVQLVTCAQDVREHLRSQPSGYRAQS